MAVAKWNGKVIAQTKSPVIVENNVYFPRDDVKMEFLSRSEKVTTCHWKGSANYYDVDVDGHLNKDAAWTYEDPLEKAAKIKDHIAFWQGVDVER